MSSSPHKYKMWVFGFTLIIGILICLFGTRKYSLGTGLSLVLISLILGSREVMKHTQHDMNRSFDSLDALQQTLIDDMVVMKRSSNSKKRKYAEETLITLTKMRAILHKQRKETKLQNWQFIHDFMWGLGVSLLASAFVMGFDESTPIRIWASILAMGLIFTGIASYYRTEVELSGFRNEIEPLMEQLRKTRKELKKL